MSGSPFARFVPVAAFLALALALAACASVPEAPGGKKRISDDAGLCCGNPERFPPWLARIGEATAPVFLPPFAALTRPVGKLTNQPAAQAAIARNLRPLDIVVINIDGGGSLVPGLFDHMALYLGTEADMRALGLWNDPAIRPYRARFEEGPVLLEAFHSGVRIQPLDRVADVDSLAILRPALGNRARRQGLRDAVALIGAPFDFHFDIATVDAIYCTEVVTRPLPQLRVPVRHVYGRDTQLPDDFVDTAIRKRGGLTLVEYIRGTGEGWSRLPLHALRAELDAAWGEADKRQRAGF